MSAPPPIGRRGGFHAIIALAASGAFPASSSRSTAHSVSDVIGERFGAIGFELG